MSHIEDSLNPGLRPGQIYSDFKLLRKVSIPELQAFFYEFVHEKTQAAYVHISREDEENSFSVAFKTVPEDSTGVAHILEHTVLCGSRKYPVRDPFFSMLKRSLSSFMNAFTAADWTMYPFSTPNRKDYDNLLGVYLDAAFFPRIDDLSFKQEGHRLEMVTDEGGEERLVFKGVVYNEMKGAMSSPDQVCRRSLTNALYPDTTYRHNSGGDPAEIPSLTHEALVAFHRRHYHPSNAFFYSYGNLPVLKHLEVIQEKVLKAFDAIDPGTDVPSQPRWDTPRKATYHYPLSEKEDNGKKSQVSLAWLTADIRDAGEVLVLSLLEEILLGNAASPLRKALMNSGFGAALSDDTGFDPDNRDTLFSCGLKEVAPEDASSIEALIMETLLHLSKGGIDPELVAAAVHQIEFHRKEVRNSPYPYGLKLLLTFGGSWFHRGDPLRVLQFDDDMARIREEIAAGPFLEKKIREYFIDNPHRVLFQLHPDPAMAGKEEARATGVLADIRKGIGSEELERIRQDAAALEALQGEKEDLSVLPTLVRGDIPPDIRTVPENPVQGLGGRCYEAPTAGIFYYSAAFGIGGLSADLLPLVPFFCYAVTKSGSERRDYMEMAKRIDTYTGGVGVGARIRTRADGTGACMSFLQLGAKCLGRNQGAMFDIISELVGAFDFSDHSRLRQLLMEYRSGLESMVVQNGHRLAMGLAARRFMPQTALHEAWYGISQLQHIKSLSEDIDGQGLSNLSDRLSAVGEQVFFGGNVESAYIGEDSALNDCRGFDADFSKLLGAKGKAPDGFRLPELGLEEEGLPREGWYTSSSVSFVAQSFQVVRREHPDAPALAVIAKMLRSLWLHREIREKGGAYGGFSVYNAENGIFSYASYRDPQIKGTLDAFDGASAFITSGDFTDEDIGEALLQVCSEIDRPDPPGPAARKAFARRLIGLSDEMRQAFKASLLTVNREQIRDVARRYFTPGAFEQAVAVISGREQLEAANEVLGAGGLEVRAI